jgi:hypothetical protein
VVEYLLACLDNPKLLLQYDLTGNRLDVDVDPHENRCLTSPDSWAGEAPEAKVYLQSPGKAERAVQFRESITRVGAEEGWSKAVTTSQSKPVPFDEPALGIVGMWRLGGGANPHFALALSEIMLRVGQRYLAWCGYERTVLLANRYWPDKDIQRQLVEHCRRRQALIEGQLPPDEVAQLRPRFEAELAYGQRYQREYQEYEAKRIAAGLVIEGEHVYDAFHATHKPIASPTGPAEQFLIEEHPFKYPPPVSLPSVLLFAGIFAFAGALLLRLLSRGRAVNPTGPGASASTAR